MRIVAISDTHEKHRSLSLPRGDVLVHCGDVTFRGDLAKFRDFDDWIASQKRSKGFKEALLIAGNHDFTLEQAAKPALKVLGSCRYLEDSGITIDGVRFWGSPWSLTFLRWAFMKDDEDLVSTWAKIPAETDILLTHGPPKNVMDRVPRDENVGSVTLRARIETIRTPAHVFGHIHEGYGTEVHGPTTFINASTCDEGYEATNAPIVFDFDPATRRVTIAA